MAAWSGHAPEILSEYEGLVLSQDVRDGEAFPLLAAIPVGGVLTRSPGAAAARLCVTKGARSCVGRARREAGASSCAAGALE